MRARLKELVLWSIVGVLLLSGCQSGSKNEVLISDYRNWVESTSDVHFGGQKNKSGETLSLISQFDGANKCTALYSDEIKKFASLVVFNAIDYREYELAMNIKKSYRNPTISAENIDRAHWEAGCSKMVAVRESLIGCELSEDNRYGVGIWTPDYFDDGDYEQQLEKAEHFIVGNGISMGIRIYGNRLNECAR